MKRGVWVLLWLALAAPGRVAARGVDPCAAGRARGPELEFSLRDASLAGALRLLAEIAGAPIVISGEVKGTITMRLRKVSFETALCVIAGLKSLRVRSERGVYLVMP